MAEFTIGWTIYALTGSVWYLGLVGLALQRAPVRRHRAEGGEDDEDDDAKITHPG